MVFVHTWLLSLLPLLLLAYWLRLRWVGTAFYPSLQFPTLRGVKSVQAQPLKYRLRALPDILRLLALAALVLALAQPQIPRADSKALREGIDIVLVMDVSESMKERDVLPSRIEAAKAVAEKFVAQRPNDRIGIVTFAGRSYVHCPLTTDQVVLREQIRRIAPPETLDGTAIGMGIANAVKRLSDSDAKSKVAILLADGANTVETVPPLDAAQAAQEKGVRIYTIGIGKEIATDNPELRVDVPLLTNIATRTGGQFFRATDAGELEKVYTQIDQLEKTKLDAISTQRADDYFQPFLWAAILLAALGAGLQISYFRTIVT